MESLKYLSRAKINWGLQVTGKRPDGFHELATLFWQISLADVLTVEISDHDDAVSCPALAIKPTENLAFRAIQAWRAAGGKAPTITVTIDKRTPAGGGLGGGSSNAATVLLALQALATTALDQSKLAQVALDLGSDVPFFLTGGCALGRGRGELLNQQPAHQRAISLVLPPFSCATPAVFQHFTLSADGAENRLETTFDSTAAAVPPNDLEAAASRAYPELAPYISAVRAAAGGMSGSGSTCVVPGHEFELPTQLPGQIVRCYTADSNVDAGPAGSQATEQ